MAEAARAGRAIVQRTGLARGTQETFQPRRRFSRRHRLGRRLRELGHQPIGPLALTLEIGPVARGGYLEPRDLRL
jgi:hypothetical protein